jgi:hypothetical protein
MVQCFAGRAFPKRGLGHEVIPFRQTGRTTVSYAGMLPRQPQEQKRKATPSRVIGLRLSDCCALGEVMRFG